VSKRKMTTHRSSTRASSTIWKLKAAKEREPPPDKGPEDVIKDGRKDSISHDVRECEQMDGRMKEGEYSNSDDVRECDPMTERFIADMTTEEEGCTGVDLCVKELRHNNRDKSEFVGDRLYLRGQEMEQRKEKLRQEAMSQTTVRKKKCGNKSSRINILYELGKNRVKGNRKMATSRIQTSTAVIPKKSSIRINALYELGKSRVTHNRKLATSKLKTSETRQTESSVSVSEIAGRRLYRQALLSEKRKADLRLKARECERKSQEKRSSEATLDTDRLFNLYELGKKRVNNKRKRAEEKNKIEPSTIVAEHANTRQTELYEMGKRKLFEVVTNKRKREEETSKAGLLTIITVDANTRQTELYEMGKRKLFEVVNNKRKREEETSKAASSPIIAEDANTRQIQLYEMGKKKLIKAKQEHEPTKNDDSLESLLSRNIIANATMIRLYESSKVTQQNCEDRRKEKEVFIKENTTSILASKLLGPNKTMKKLYDMSKEMQQDGKERREEIICSKVNFPVLKV